MFSKIRLLTARNHEISSWTVLFIFLGLIDFTARFLARVGLDWSFRLPYLGILFVAGVSLLVWGMLNLFDPLGKKKLADGESAFKKNPDFVDIAMSKTREILLREVGPIDQKNTIEDDMEDEIREEKIVPGIVLSAALVVIFFIIADIIAYGGPNNSVLYYSPIVIGGLIYGIVRFCNIKKEKQSAKSN